MGEILWEERICTSKKQYTFHRQQSSPLYSVYTVRSLFYQEGRLLAINKHF